MGSYVLRPDYRTLLFSVNSDQGLLFGDVEGFFYSGAKTIKTAFNDLFPARRDGLAETARSTGQLEAQT